MKKYISLARREYEIAYRQLRLYGEGLFHIDPGFPGCTEEECALESRDWYDSEFSGWINRQRMNKFTFITTNRNELDWLPF